MNGSLLRTNEELSQIYDRHVKTVYRVCFMYMKNAHDTQDMVQNTFIRLMEDSTIFEGHEHEKAWLIRAASNLCKDHYKSMWNKTVGIEQAAHVTVELTPEIDETLQMVLNLPPKYRTAVYLYYYEGYSTVDISGILCKNESTVRSWLHTGRKLLKIEMEGEEN